MKNTLNLKIKHSDKLLPLILENLKKVEVSVERVISKEVLEEKFDEILKMEVKRFNKPISKL